MKRSLEENLDGGTFITVSIWITHRICHHLIGDWAEKMGRDFFAFVGSHDLSEDEKPFERERERKI